MAVARPAGPAPITRRSRSSTPSSYYAAEARPVRSRPPAPPEPRCMLGIMAARSIGTGTISFGMVSIPIKLYAAGESKAAVSFNLLHDKCKSRLKQQYICPKENEIVTRDHMVKGYEFAKEQYVAFTEEEIKSMAE